MALQKTECLVAYCDGCGTPREHNYIPHYESETAALDDLQDGEWTVWEGKIWCENCSPPCVCGHLFGEHDYGHEPCQDCACKGYTVSDAVGEPEP